MASQLSIIAKIENNLYLGSSYSITPKKLEECNITYIFHLGFEISESLLDGRKHEYFDLEDDSESVDKMMEISKYIVKRIEELIDTETILVCCVAGRSRSASMIALYLHHKYPTLSYDEIINDKIKRFRSISINPSFSEAIRNKMNNNLLIYNK